MHPKAAGIDVGNEEHWVAVPPDLDREPVSVGCFTQDLVEMANWLVRCGMPPAFSSRRLVAAVPLCGAANHGGPAFQRV